MADGKHEVMARRCDQCLFGKDRIVSGRRAAEIIAQTARDNVPFLCHKATIARREITCRGSYERDGGGNIGRIMQRLGAVRFIDPETMQEQNHG
jgi:hypothetical protein